MGRDTCLHLYHFLNGIARRRRHILDVLFLEFLRLSRLSFHLRNAYLVDGIIVLKEDDLQRLLTSWITQDARLALIAYHGECDRNTIR